jgi:hypothetical protein
VLTQSAPSRRRAGDEAHFFSNGYLVTKSLVMIKLYTSLLLLSISSLAFSHAPDTIKWTVIMGERTAGFTKLWKNADGTISEWFQYNDRGRGDSTVTRYKEDEQGFITFYEGAGVDYFKKPVFEKFYLEQGVARWENNAEKESKPIKGKALYSPLKVSAGSSLRHFFISSDSAVDLIPSGRQKLRLLKTETLSNGKKVYLCMTTGTSLTPNYFWMDEQKNFFGYVSDWFSTIRSGNEGDVAKLISIQKPYVENYYRTLAKKLTKSASKIAVTNATVFSPKTKTTTPNTTILIEDGIIRELRSDKNVPKDYTVVNAAGKFVMPGLWDMHVHYGGEYEGLLHVASGITNVRDMGNSEALLERIKEIEDGTVIGPRVQARCGFIDGAGPYAGPTGAIISNVEEGKAAVKKYADLGYTQIKLYSSLKPEWIKPIADEAHKFNLRVSGHIPAHMIAEEAINAGYNEIQHMNMVFLNFYGKELDTRTPLRFTHVAQQAGSLDFNDAKVKSFLALLKSKNIVIDPTVSIFENMFTNEAGKMSTTMSPVANRLPPNLQRSLKSGADAIATEASQKETYRKSFEAMLKMINTLYTNGITIVPGTDDFVGFVLHRELENYVKAGIPAADVLRIATLQSAQVAGKDAMYGNLEKGKAADIIIIDGNPLQNISDVRKTQTIIKGKSIYSAKDLYEAISIKGE